MRGWRINAGTGWPSQLAVVVVVVFIVGHDPENDKDRHDDGKDQQQSQEATSHRPLSVFDNPEKNKMVQPSLSLYVFQFSKVLELEMGT